MSDHPMSTKAQTDLSPNPRRLSPARRKANAIAERLPASGSGGSAPRSNFRCEWLFVVRESSEYDYLMFEKMIQQTLEPYGDRPGVRKALDLGLRLFNRGSDGDLLRSKLGARTLFQPGRDKVFGYLFQLDGDWFLYALTSAARTTRKGENEWTERLCETLRDLKPKQLGAGPTSRIARRKELGGQVAIAVKQVGTRVHVYEAPQGLDLREAGGDATWTALVMAADFEYQNTIARLVTGTLFELKNNRFPRAERQLLPGFVFARDQNGKAISGQVVPDPDPERIQMVRDLLAAGATSATNNDIAMEFSPRGLVARGGRRASKGLVVSASDTTDPGRVVATVFAHLQTYLTGKYVFTLECAIPNLEKMHGLMVNRVYPEDQGFFEVELDFGLPAGGFISPGLAEQLSDRRLDNQPGTAGVQQDESSRKPLSGRRRWTRDGHEYAMLPDGPDYIIRRRPAMKSAPPDGSSDPTFARYDGELLGRLNARDLHKRLSASILSALAGPVTTDRLDWCGDQALGATKTQQATTELARLHAQARELRQRAQNNRQLAGAATSPAERSAYADQARDAQEQGDSILARAGDLQGLITQRPVDGVKADVGPLIASLLLLATTKDKASYDLHVALREHLVDLQVDAKPSDPTAEVSVRVRLTTEDGGITLGPVLTMVKNSAVGLPGTSRRRRSIVSRNRALTYSWLLDGQHADEVAEIEGVDQRRLKRAAHEALRDLVHNEDARAAIIDCPVLQTRRVVLGDLVGHPTDGDFSPRRADEVRRLYLDPAFSWTQSWVSQATLDKRAVLAFIDRYASDPDEGLELAVLCDRMGRTEVGIYALLDETGKYLGTKRRGLPSKAVLERGDRWVYNVPTPASDKRLLVRRCHWCGQRSLLQPLRVPEVVDELICTPCRCSASEREPWPAEYLLSWEGPFGRRGPALGATADGKRRPVGTRLAVMPPLPLLHGRPRR